MSLCDFLDEKQNNQNKNLRPIASSQYYDKKMLDAHLMQHSDARIDSTSIRQQIILAISLWQK